MRSSRGSCRRIFNPRRALVVLVAVLMLGCVFGPAASEAASPWSAPVHFYTPETPGWTLTSVSCNVAKHCVAAEGEGNVLIENGSGWSGLTKIDGYNSLWSVSCVPQAPFYCITVGGAHELTLEGSTWSSPGTIDGDFRILLSVSCPSAVHCGALDDSGYVTLYNGSTWTEPVEVLKAGSGRSISCTTTPSFSCLVSDRHGNVAFYNGSTWSSPANINGESNIRSVSCASSSECMAITEGGEALEFKEGSWSRTTVSGPPLYSVSCVPGSSPLACAAVGFNGSVYMFDGSTWSTFAGVDSHGEILSISCPLRTYCKAVDVAGYEVTYNGPPVPENIKPPVILGVPTQGQTLNEVHGEWLYGPTSYEYQWERCNSSGSGCEAVSGATSFSYPLEATDVGHTIRVTETARNFTGVSSPVTSAVTAVVQPLAPPKEEKPTEKPGGGKGGGPKEGGGGHKPPVVTQCKVPNLRGKTLGHATELLFRHHCSLGKVSKRHKRHHRRHHHRLRVISQHPGAGTVLPNEARVSVKLG